eukprot:m.202849 g.202849  ORF g.202849 m.202849 type:complete len:520 (-) comp21955_c0_seq1:27-1586(-)
MAMDAVNLARRLQDLDVPDCGECFGFGQGCKDCNMCDVEKCFEEGPGQLCRDFCSMCNKSPCGTTNMCLAMASALDFVSGPLERFADVIWVLGSPLAFPCVFLFPKTNPPYDEAQYPNQWDHFMIYAPCQHCLYCCGAYLCMPCALYQVRKRILDNDMSKYKCCQGRYDGPYCCAAYCEGQPFTLKAGTHGEKDNPHLCLCLEAHCCLCCSFYSSRGYMRDERAYAMDPTEIRVQRCISFFHMVARYCWCLGCCFWCSGCLLMCLHPGDDADALGAASMRAGQACIRIGRIIWNGIINVQCISFACMIAQMNHEMDKYPNLDEAIARGDKARKDAKLAIVNQQPKPDPATTNPTYGHTAAGTATAAGSGHAPSKPPPPSSSSTPAAPPHGGYPTTHQGPPPGAYGYGQPGPYGGGSGSQPHAAPYPQQGQGPPPGAYGSQGYASTPSHAAPYPQQGGAPYGQHQPQPYPQYHHQQPPPQHYATAPYPQQQQGYGQPYGQPSQQHPPPGNNNNPYPNYGM